MQTNQKTFGRKIVSVAMSALMMMSMIPAALATSTGQITSVPNKNIIYEGSQITMTATGADNVTNHIDWAVEGYTSIGKPQGAANISKHRGVLTAVTPGFIKVTAYLSDGALPEPGHGGGHGGGNGNLCTGATEMASVVLEIKDAVAYGFQGDGQNSMKVVNPGSIRFDYDDGTDPKTFHNTILDSVPVTTTGTAEITYELSAGGNQDWPESDYNGIPDDPDNLTNPLRMYHTNQMELQQINTQTGAVIAGLNNCISVTYNSETKQFTARLSGLTAGGTYRLTVKEGMQSKPRGQQGGKRIDCRIEFTFTATAQNTPDNINN